jgi:hypothetical protein
MPKITIYVPDDLKAAMDAVESQQPNWSAFAQEAFRLECRRLANRKGSKGKMDTVVERLRASKQKFENEENAKGHAAGRAWAMQGAEYDELERLNALDEVGFDQTWSYEICKVVYGEEVAAQGCAEFWSKWGNRGEPSEDFAAAFAEGACEVFNEVQEKL